MTKTKEQWAEVFSTAKAGHVMWDGNAEDPYDPVHAYTTSKEFIQFGQTLGFFKKGDKILDIGCGNGRFCIPLSEMIVNYTGIDPMLEQIIFCQNAFKDYKHLKFAHCDVRNEVFNPNGSIPPEQYRFPFPDGYFDDIIAYSVFTHLQTLLVASHYMDEVRRTLKTGGKFFVTWYRSPPDPIENNFVGRTVYHEWDIMTIMQGFKFQVTYGGHTAGFYDQWGIFCERI